MSTIDLKTLIEDIEDEVHIINLSFSTKELFVLIYTMMAYLLKSIQYDLKFSRSKPY